MHAVYHIIELLKSPIGLLAKKGQFLFLFPQMKYTLTLPQGL